MISWNFPKNPRIDKDVKWEQRDLRFEQYLISDGLYSKNVGNKIKDY